MASNLYNTIAMTTRAFIASFELAVHKNDSSLLNLVIAPDCMRHVAPVRTLGISPTNATDVETYTQNLAPIVRIVEDGKCITLMTCIDPVERKAVTRVEHHTKYLGRDWICLEVCWLLDFTEDGRAITKVVEFVDSGIMVKYTAMAKEVENSALGQEALKDLRIKAEER